MKKFALINQGKHDGVINEFNTLDAAIKDATMYWRHLTAKEKAERVEFSVVNFDDKNEDWLCGDYETLKDFLSEDNAK